MLLHKVFVPKRTCRVKRHVNGQTAARLSIAWRPFSVTCLHLGCCHIGHTASNAGLGKGQRAVRRRNNQRRRVTTAAMPMLVLADDQTEAAMNAADSDLRYLLSEVGVPDEVHGLGP